MIPSFQVARFFLLYPGDHDDRGDLVCHWDPVDLAPVVQRPDNFIQWISHYPTVSICAKISVFPLVQANMNTVTTA